MKFRSALTSTPVQVDLSGCNGPITLAAIPGSGSTVLVEVSVGPLEHDPVNWIPWEAGTVSAAKREVLLGPVSGVRFTRASGSTTCYAELFSNG